MKGISFQFFKGSHGNLSNSSGIKTGSIYDNKEQLYICPILTRENFAVIEFGNFSVRSASIQRLLGGGGANAEVEGWL